jgi:hypothetical protein
MKLSRRPKVCNDKRNYYRKEYLLSEHWKCLRLRKLMETPWCEKCYTSCFLDVHHRRYRNLYDVLLSDLMVLCRKCHANVHKILDRSRAEERKELRNKKLRRKDRLAVNHVAKMLGISRGEVARYLPKIRTQFQMASKL